MTYLVVVLCGRREFPKPYSPAGQNPSPLLCLGASVTPEQTVSPSRSKKKTRRKGRFKKKKKITEEFHSSMRMIPPTIKAKPLSAVMVSVYNPGKDGWIPPDQAIAKLLKKQDENKKAKKKSRS